MESPFAEASSVKPRLKLMIWGPSGVGKTILSLSLPKPVMLDLEEGSTYYGESFKFGVLPVNGVADIYKGLKFLKSGRHEYKTLIFDSVSVYWEMVQKKWEAYFLSNNTKGAGNKGTYYDFQPGDWAPIKSEYNQLLEDLKAIDMNVVITAREKTLYADTSDFMKVAGKTFDGEKNTDYKFDTVVRLFIEAGKRKAWKQKDRSNKLPSDPFDLSYENFEKFFGKEVLEREPVRFVSIKEAEVKKIFKLIEELKLDTTSIRAGFAKYGASKAAELSEEQGKIVISNLTKLKKEKAK